MKLLYATSVKSEVEVKGKTKTVKEHVFKIKDDEAFTSEEVTFKVIAVRNRLMTWDAVAKNFSNESVFFEGVYNNPTIPDKKGGNACGRVFVTWGHSEAEVAASKDNAKWYTYLFGEVTFPGQKPVLVNYRLTGSQSMAWSKIEKEIKDDFGSVLLKLTAVPNAKNDEYAVPEYKIAQTGLDTSENHALEDEIDEFLETENGKVLDAYHAANAGKPAPKAQSQELDDEIPF